MKEKIHRYVTGHKEEMTALLKELVKIPSVRGEREDGKPFGGACADALKYINEIYSKNGFETEIDEDGGYAIAYLGAGKRSLGLFAHADVVGVNDDWTYTKPFEPIEKDGYLIGRGTLDDKSAVVISLYCMKMIKELEIPFKSRLVCFTGSCEETGMEDVGNYLKKHSPPDFSLVCDTAFPLYRGNKCGMNFCLTLKNAPKDVEDFCGGNAANITLGEATAIVGGERLTETGVSHHSALPSGSVNAGYLLAKRISGRSDICPEDKEQMTFVSTLLEKYYGEVFGIEHEDGEFGKLTCANGIIRTENGRIKLYFNMRYGLSADIRSIKKKITDFAEENDCTVDFEEEKRGYIMPEDDEYIQACLKAYTDFTGDANPVVQVNAGGTYARKLARAAEVGTTLIWGTPDGTPPGCGGAHQPDECINAEGMCRAAELIMNMLIECDKTEE